MKRGVGVFGLVPAGESNWQLNIQMLFKKEWSGFLLFFFFVVVVVVFVVFVFVVFFCLFLTLYDYESTHPVHREKFLTV